MEENKTNKIAFTERFIAKVKEWRGTILGIVLGGIGGYLYYRLVGCSSGACPITSNPWMSILWGIALGYLLGESFNKNKKKTQNHEQP